MGKRHTPPVMVAAVIETARNGLREMLIARLPSATGDEDDGAWAFPFGPLEAGESPEAAIRRILADQLGMQPHIQHGQPPFDHAYRDVMYRWRFLFGEVAGPEMNNRYYADVRWVPRPSLREYEFEPVSQQVVDWLLEE